MIDRILTNISLNDIEGIKMGEGISLDYIQSHNSPIN